MNFHDADRLLEEQAEEAPQDWAALRTTLIIYGSLFGFFSVTFCCVRRQFPAVYDVRSYVPRLHCKLSENMYGLVNWAWKVMKVPDDDIYEQCGMDALCLLRIFRLGFRVSLVGIFCSVFLIPIYATADPGDKLNTNETSLVGNETETWTVDPWIKITASHLPVGSNRAIAIAVAAYLLFGSSMYFLWRDFQWFTVMRARFLSEQEPRNYAVYVSGIPSQRRSDAALATYFRRIFSDETVLEASVVLNIPKLDARVKERNETQLKLEHAEALRDVKGVAVPMHTIVTADKAMTAADRVVERVPAIEYYQEKLRNLDDEINSLRAKIEERRQAADKAFLERSSTSSIQQATSSTINATQAEPSVNSSSMVVGRMDSSGANVVSEEVGGSFGDNEQEDGVTRSQLSSDIPRDDKKGGQSVSESQNDDSASHSASEALSGVTDLVGLPASAASHSASEALSGVTNLVGLPASAAGKFLSNSADFVASSSAVAGEALSKSADMVASSSAAAGDALLRSAELVGLSISNNEGVPLSAGFVIFDKLSTVSAACQMVHTSDPSGMHVFEPPQPDALIWANVGMPPPVRQTRQLISFAITGTVCVFWTVPVTFLVSLTQPETLKNTFPRIEDLLEANPWLEGLLNQLGPLLIQLMNNVVLPDLMKLISRLEGAIGQSRLLASMTTKMSAFAIIQTFFIASIAGSIIEGFGQFSSVGDIFRWLAATLPPRSEFFIQLVLIDSVLILGLELLRTTALIKAGLRKCMGPRLTEKERSIPWMSCRPLNNPRNFLFAHVYSDEALHFMVLFVFTVLAPLIAYVLAFAFLVMEIGNRNQFFFIYPSTPDSGGRIWMELITVILCCMPIAESILLAATGLGQAAAAFFMLIPLLVITILFVIYMRFRYFPIFIHLPTEDCAESDARNSAECGDFDFVLHKYRQPALTDDDNDDDDDDGAQGQPVVEP